MEPFWAPVNEPTLRQGDYLPHCLVPVFGQSLANPGEVQDVVVDEFDLIVVTSWRPQQNRRTIADRSSWTFARY